MEQYHQLCPVYKFSTFLLKKNLSLYPSLLISISLSFIKYKGFIDISSLNSYIKPMYMMLQILTA